MLIIPRQNHLTSEYTGVEESAEAWDLGSSHYSSHYKEFIINDKC